ncbi:MAG: hypothetical protein KDI71_12555 [Xanthomonadales bacterium]|nr:hypothetical protein [Xanthomonadales bacterium]
MRTLQLAMALSPYLICAGLDAWWHERGRVVPRTEWWLHLLLALCLIAFLIGVFARLPMLAFGALGLFVPLHLSDAIGFHRDIDRRERLVHAAANLALIAFVTFWISVDSLWP